MKRVVIIGGGAAGFFGAIACAEKSSSSEVMLLERGPQFLQKVRISGGGRCNVTHACFEPRELTKRYPRGDKELISPFHKFQASDTVKWFEDRDVKLKTEADGRMFPTTDSSQTIIDCLMDQARRAGVQLRTNCGVDAISKNDSGFELQLSTGEELFCDYLLLATGGCRSAAQAALAVSLGHTIKEPVPSLFTFHIDVPWLRALAGVSLPEVEASVPDAKLRERGPILVTHWGLSGPVILRLSAWGARALHERNYKFTLLLNWLPRLNESQLNSELESRAKSQPARMIVNSTIAPLSARLWEALVIASGIEPATRWSELGRARRHQLAQTLSRMELSVTGKSLNKDEFVTCGGVSLREVNFQTMESRLTPNVYFAGELLDIDGITGGFNFQSAWTTGWIAGNSIATKV